MKVKLMIDNVNYKSKPVGKEVGKIVNRIKPKQITIEELANKIVEGCSFRPSVLNGTKEENWTEQQIFALDFDTGTTIEEELNRCNILKIKPVFAYTTFNNTEEHNKFRLVFCTDKVITDYNTAKQIQTILMNLFDKSDKQCSNLSRLYFGGRELVYTNYSNIINSKELLNKYSELCYNKSLNRKGVPNIYNINNINYIRYPKNPSDNILNDNKINYNIQAIKEHNIRYLKSVLNINYSKIIFETQQEFFDYILKIDLAKLLDIPNNRSKTFNCIFHDDKNPSASIFIDDETGNYLYKCNANTCGVTYNIIGIIERLGNFKSRPKTYQFIKELFNLEIMETEWQKEQKEILIENLKSIHNGELEKNCPQAYKNNKKILRYLEQMHLIALDNIYNEKITDSEGNVIFFASRSYIAEKLNISLNSLNKVSQKLVVLAYHRLLNKLDDEEIPENLLKKSKHINAKDNKKNYKHINYFSIPSYTYNLYQEIEKQGKKWKENHYTMKGVSREMFYRAEGKEVADKLFPQYKKITKQGKEVDRTTSKTSDKRTNAIVKVIFNSINDKGYITEREIIEELKSEFGKTKIEKQIKKSLQEILDSYDLKRIRTNKKIKEQFGITLNGYPFIIVQNQE